MRTILSFLLAVVICPVPAVPFPADLTYVDSGPGNTAAAAGTPDPYYSVNQPDTNGTALWWFRSGFGFDEAGNNGIYEKDRSDSGGDGAQLHTTITGLTPGQSYGVYVCYLSAANDSWRLKAGLSPATLIDFNRTTPADRIVANLGLTSVASSNREQLIGWIGNKDADGSGEISVTIDDFNPDGDRCWYDGVAYGDPYVPPPPPGLPGGAVEIAPDGAWTWFNDERTIVLDSGALLSGYVKADGNIAVTRFHPDTGDRSETILSGSGAVQQDDHNNPSLTVLPDGRILAMYSLHGSQQKYYYRFSTGPDPATAADWGGQNDKTVSAGNTYCNTYQLSNESNRLYLFHRCIGFNPNWSVSDDHGVNWSSPTELVRSGGTSTRPYPRYASDRSGRIDLIYTDGHPRNENNSVYHMFYTNGNLRASNGDLLKAMADTPLLHDSGERGTVVYAYNASAWGPEDGPDDWMPSGRGWTWDIHYGEDGSPVCVISVRRGNVTGTGWNHNRIYYYYARWTGSAWQKRFIAQAGRPLYSNEGDYAGGISIDPDTPNVVYMSSNAADPFNLDEIDNVPLAPDDRYELYRGVTADGGLTFTWTQLTEDSAVDNLRPIVPENHGREQALVWFYGTYTTYKMYDTQVIGDLGLRRTGPRVLGVDFNKNDQPAAPTQPLCRVIAGSATASANPASLQKTIGGVTVDIQEPGAMGLEFRGANGDSSRDMPGGTTGQAALVADLLGIRTGVLTLEFSGLPTGNYIFRSRHLESFNQANLGFAQGHGSTSPNTYQAAMGGIVRAQIQPTALGASGLGTTLVGDADIPTLEVPFASDGLTPVVIELTALESNGGNTFLFLNGFEIFEEETP